MYQVLNVLHEIYYGLTGFMETTADGNLTPTTGLYSESNPLSAEFLFIIIMPHIALHLK